MKEDISMVEVLEKQRKDREEITGENIQRLKDRSEKLQSRKEKAKIAKEVTNKFLKSFGNVYKDIVSLDKLQTIKDKLFIRVDNFNNGNHLIDFKKIENIGTILNINDIKTENGKTFAEGLKYINEEYNRLIDGCIAKLREEKL